MNKIHFHSIDALRFFAFLKIYLLHVPVQGDFPIFSYLKSGGGIGVAFFFVLSGFLITYLLVFDKIENGQINIKKFLIRRSLRIWPLFYLMVIIVFLLPYEFKQNAGFHMVGGGYDLDWRYSFSFLENYKMLILDLPVKTTPLTVFWSLCIEEHFYLFWMTSLFFIPIKHLKKFFVISFFIAWAARIIEPLIFENVRIDSNDLFTNLDYFASGGILGFMVAKDYNKVATFIQKIPTWIKYSVIVFVILIVVFQKEILPYETGSIFFIFRSSIIAIIFTFLIAVFIPLNSVIKIKNPVLSYLGKISYGLYVYHIIWIHVIFQYMINRNIKIDDWLTLSIFIGVTLGGSVLVSSLSFRYFETPFLSLRERLTKTRSK
ncbi:MAG: acyltransferase [Prolixibacteraceae bacterium]|jgi:peptidoglycan/LPS O-acetylase OafA/YrhL|nr:acyltransferase [Prolixibacteraceae bacterium]MBT6006692.1 acyltransferase [Prolixibacteraceae bacterium]MBT6765596.1 acyltransferase [Prolixibacteraceae bacterium]MBT6997171.1 acyltransferase [Prolixibacteraceae bacterium]MBT7396668.1 acyltransferase [Prolixibacteraceae bacterium]